MCKICIDIQKRVGPNYLCTKCANRALANAQVRLYEIDGQVPKRLRPEFLKFLGGFIAGAAITILVQWAIV